MSGSWATVGEGKTFTGVKDGEVYPHDFVEGDIIDGGLSDVAVKAKKAVRGKGKRPADPSPENKDLGASPENADGSALGERVRYLQDENSSLGEIVGQQKSVLITLGVDAEFAEKLSAGEASEEEIKEFSDKVQAARDAKAEDKDKDNQQNNK